VKFPHRLLEDADALASFKGWGKDVYEDFFRFRRGEMSESEFREKYSRERAILSIDMTGLSISTVKLGELQGLTRILDAQRVAIPVMQDYGAELVRCFADDIVALFLEPGSAIDAALEIHRRVRLFNASPLASEHPTLCCAGIGYGRVLAIGPNLAQGLRAAMKHWSRNVRMTRLLSEKISFSNARITTICCSRSTGLRSLSDPPGITPL
jgi:hypothetical protein